MVTPEARVGLSGSSELRETDCAPDLELALRSQELREFELIRILLCDVVRKAGEHILSYRGLVYDTGVQYGHEASNIDDYATSVVSTLLDEMYENVDGIRRFEHRQVDITVKNKTDVRPSGKLVFIIDEIDGTTNTKRVLSNLQPFSAEPHPQAGTSIAICTGENLDTLRTGAIYTFDTGETFSAQRVAEDYFFAFRNGIKINFEDRQFENAKGDSVNRIMVIGYSNKNRLEKGRWEDKLHNKAKFRVYEGCRASSIDVINMTRGNFDAYVDARALWGEKSGAMLQAYDISAAIAIAKGYGFIVTDVFGEPYQKYGLNDAIPIVISRSQMIHEKILETIRPLTKRY